MKFPALEELEAKIEAKSRELAAVFDEAGPELDLSRVKSVPGDTMAKVEWIRKANDELTDLGKQRDELLVVQKAAERVRVAPGPGGRDDSVAVEPGSENGQRFKGGRSETKTIGQLFVESKAYRGKTGTTGPEAHLDIDLKTLMSTGAGWAPETTRTGRVVESAQRPIQVADVIPQTTTSQAAVVYMEETVFNNTAAEVAESTQSTPGTYPEAELSLTEKSSPVRKIAVYLPVTDEQMEDEPQVRGYIDNRLPFMIRQRLDAQLLVGNGVAPNLTGLLNVSGTQTQAKGTDPTPDAVYKAMVKVQTIGQALPNVVLFHPNDWQDVRLLRTADGLYIWGNPSDAGPERIWGLQVVKAQALTENTAIVGDFANFCELAVRRGIDVQVSNSHGTYFVEGKQAIRADIRVAFVVYRPAAFCEVTGV